MSRLTKHEAAGSALLARVREAAADLVTGNIGNPPPPNMRLNWKGTLLGGPAPANSILDASALAFMRWMPRSSRERAPPAPDRLRYGKGGPAQCRKP